MSHVSSMTSYHLFSDTVTLLKPRITLLALMTTAAGMWISPATISTARIFLTLLGLGLLVGGASALNMFLERDADLLMERTRFRPLPGKRLTPEFGLGVGSLLIGVAIPLLWFWVNPLTGFLGFLSLAVYVLIYTPLKKKTGLSLWIGAIPGAAPPLLGWTAATGSLSLPGVILFFIIFFWQIPHFLAIGTFRREDYLQAGFKIFPLKQKPGEIRLQMVLVSLLLFPISLALVPLGYAGAFYFWSTLVLNIYFLTTVMWGIWGKEEGVWGRRVFFASLIYLTGVFLSLFVDGGAVL